MPVHADWRRKRGAERFLEGSRRQADDSGVRRAVRQGRCVYVITGGAGFIGSNIAAALDQQGADIVTSDWMGANDFKWRNIAKRRLFDIVPPDATRNRSLVRGSLRAACATDRLRRREAGNTRPRGVRRALRGTVRGLAHNLVLQWLRSCSWLPFRPNTNW